VSQYLSGTLDVSALADGPASIAKKRLSYFMEVQLVPKATLQMLPVIFVTMAEPASLLWIADFRK
jgi:hypothetical protein